MFSFGGKYLRSVNKRIRSLTSSITPVSFTMTTRKGHGDLGNNVPFKKPKLQAEMWCDDSDDDDLILLASQAVEQVNIW